MKYVLAVLFAILFGGCGLWSGYAPGFSGYIPPAAYGAAGYGGYAAYPVDPLSGGYPIPPSNVCFLHRPPPWCEGPRCLPVTNETEDLRLWLWIDGVAIDLPETGGFLPPGKTCWLIADAVGRHEAQARAYIGPPPLQLAAACSREFWIDATGRGHHGVEISSLNCSTVPPTSAGP